MIAITYFFDAGSAQRSHLKWGALICTQAVLSIMQIILFTKCQTSLLTASTVQCCFFFPFLLIDIMVSLFNISGQVL